MGTAVWKLNDYICRAVQSRGFTPSILGGSLDPPSSQCLGPLVFVPQKKKKKEAEKRRRKKNGGKKERKESSEW